MTEPPAEPDDARDLLPHPGLPRWVKASAVVIVVLILVLVLAMLLAGGEHGPGRHAGSLPWA